MRVFDAYKERTHSVIDLGEHGSFKIPNEYTVEEAERLLELEIEFEKVSSEETTEDSTPQQTEQLKRFYGLVFARLGIIFQHYQPEMTAEKLRSIVSHREALEILGFYNKYRPLAVKQSEESDSKKKSSRIELRDLRRMVAFMVINGFSLFDIRKLYIDELFTYYSELFFVLEQSGRVKEGSYDKIRANANSSANATVNILRKQLFKSIADTNKKR